MAVVHGQDVVKKLGQWGKKYRYPMLILAVGMVLMLLPQGNDTKTAEVTEAASKQEFHLEAFTEQTEQLLDGLAGAGQVQVLFTLETDGERTYGYDETSRQTPDTTEQERKTVLLSQGSQQEPLMVTQSYPCFRGAVVLCQGAGVPQVVLEIKEAISSLTGLGMDKITVLEMD